MPWPRVLSAGLLLPPLAAVVWFGEPWFTLALLGIGLVGTWEFYSFARRAEVRPLVILGLGGTFLFILARHSTDPRSLPLAISGFLLASGIALLLRWERATALQDWAYTVAGAFYVGWLLSYFIPLRQEGRAWGDWVLFAIFATFAVDTSAYLVGKLAGRHLMAPSISPRKTWEGAAGGFAGGLGGAVALTWLLKLPLSYDLALALGAIIAVFALLGDLVESLFKRSLGIREASHLIPGHGGILDRLDSLLFTVVVVYYFLTLT